MSSTVRYTAAKRRAVETARQQRVAAELAAQRDMSVEQLAGEYRAALSTTSRFGRHHFATIDGELVDVMRLARVRYAELHPGEHVTVVEQTVDGTEYVACTCGGELGRGYYGDRAYVDEQLARDAAEHLAAVNA